MITTTTTAIKKLRKLFPNPALSFKAAITSWSHNNSIPVTLEYQISVVPSTGCLQFNSTVSLDDALNQAIEGVKHEKLG